MRSKLLFIFAALAYLANVNAADSVTSEPGGTAYYFTSHYSIDINAPSSAVWDQLIDLGSWMYEFDLSLEFGEPGQAGAVRRLYAGQDFFIETTMIVPNELLVFANLPATFNGELSTGIAVIALIEVEGVTTVSLTMSRRYSWDSEEPNPMRAVRESVEFQERTRTMWEDGFLGRLRSLVEGDR